jgi:hypothetical protein
MHLLTSRIGTLSFAVALVAASGVRAQEYEPSEGDSVVVYTNTFKAEFFGRAKQIMVEGFSEAMEQSGQTRKTFWFANEQSGEIIGVSFFQKGHGTEEWHDHDARAAVLERLAPMRSKPLNVQHYSVIGDHETGQ